VLDHLSDAESRLSVDRCHMTINAFNCGGFQADAK